MRHPTKKQMQVETEDSKRVTYKSQEWERLVYAGWSTVDVEGQGSDNPIAIMQPPLSLEDQLLIERSLVKFLQADIARLQKALEFYANHIHWMGLAGDSELQTVLVAGKLWDMNGWAVAEDALNNKR